jgi:hypothetical protein
VAGTIDTGDPIQVIVFSLAIPIFIGVGLWIACRPVQAFRASYFNRSRTPTRTELTYYRVFGGVFTA